MIWWFSTLSAFAFFLFQRSVKSYWLDNPLGLIVDIYKFCFYFITNLSFVMTEFHSNKVNVSHKVTQCYCHKFLILNLSSKTYDSFWQGFSGTSHFYETVCHSLTQTRRFMEQSDRILLGQLTVYRFVGVKSCRTWWQTFGGTSHSCRLETSISKWLVSSL